MTCFGVNAVLIALSLIGLAAAILWYLDDSEAEKRLRRFGRFLNE